MRNKQLIDKRFEQIDSRIKTLKYLLSRQSSVQDFNDEISKLENTIDDLKSLIERDLTPLRNG
jgi:archaellum component FlaC